MRKAIALFLVVSIIGFTATASSLGDSDTVLRAILVVLGVSLALRIAKEELD